MSLGPLPPQNPSTVNDIFPLFFIFNKKILSIKKPDRNIFNAINFIVKLDQVVIFKVAEHSFGSLRVYGLCQIMARERLQLTS